MVTLEPPPPRWVNQLPSAYDVVTAYYPETKPKGELRLRPCLVTKVVEFDDGTRAPMVAFGTTKLKIPQRLHLDLVIQNAADMTRMGLAMATRFDLDSEIPLPWIPQFFGCWGGYATPKIGALTEPYIKDYAYKMMIRRSVG